MKSSPQLAPRIFSRLGQIGIDGRFLGYFDCDRSEGTPERFRLSCWLRDDRFVFMGGPHGEHSIAAESTITDAARLIAHWNGYVENTKRHFGLVEVVS